MRATRSKCTLFDSPRVPEDVRDLEAAATGDGVHGLNDGLSDPDLQRSLLGSLRDLGDVESSKSLAFSSRPWAPLAGMPWDWTVEDVQGYLAQLGLVELQASFREHNVTGVVLLSLSEEDMRDSLGVWKFGYRRELMLKLRDVRAWLDAARGDDLETPRCRSPRSPRLRMHRLPTATDPGMELDPHLGEEAALLVDFARRRHRLD